MDLLKKLTLGFCLIILAVILITGCTRKDNLTGNNWSDTHALTINDKTGLIMGYSFPADTTGSISSSNTKLLAGSEGSATAVAYLRFSNLPASSSIVDMDGSADSCYISLNVLKRSPFTRNPIQLQLFKVNRTWTDTLSTITEGNLSPILNGVYTLTDSVSIIGKQIKIPVSYQEILSWEDDMSPRSIADSTGFNLALKVTNSGWVEIASAEVATGPLLYFKYKIEGDTSFRTYSAKAVNDSYTLDAPLATASAAWKIDNLSPTRMFIKFNPNYTLFKDTEGNQLDSIAIKRLTINKATLVLHVKANSYYTGTSTYTLYPFNVNKDSINTITPLLKSDYEIITYTTSSNGLVYDDSVEVDITPIIQAYTSGDKTPKGIMIQSMQERQNFGSLEFWDCFTTDESLKPYVRIKYTPPFL